MNSTRQMRFEPRVINPIFEEDLGELGGCLIIRHLSEAHQSMDILSSTNTGPKNPQQYFSVKDNLVARLRSFQLRSSLLLPRFLDPLLSRIQRTLLPRYLSHILACFLV